MIDHNALLPLLRNVKDPMTGRDIIESKMVHDLKVNGNNVHFTLKLPNPDAPYKSNLIFDCMSQIKTKFPEAEVDIHVEASKTNSDVLSPLPQVKNLIAVASGKGGVGKSTVAVNLAVALKNQGFKVGIIDADLYGPSLPTMLGLQGERPQIKESYGVQTMIPLDYNGMPVMSLGFIIQPEQAVVLRGPKLSGILKQFVSQCHWPDLDYLLIDLPPGTGDIHLTLVQTLPLTGAVMVTTPQEVAVVDAVKAANMFLIDNIKVPVLGIIENMAWFTPEELPDNKYYIFGQGGAKKLSRLVDAPVLGQVPIMMSVREGGDQGNPVAADSATPAGKIWQELALKLDEAVQHRNATLDPTNIVKITTY